MGTLDLRGPSKERASDKGLAENAFYILSGSSFGEIGVKSVALHRTVCQEVRLPGTLGFQQTTSSAMHSM